MTQLQQQSQNLNFNIMIIFQNSQVYSVFWNQVIHSPEFFSLKDKTKLLLLVRLTFFRTSSNPCIFYKFFILFF